MASAIALEYEGLRLRSRRTRSGRSHRLPLGFVLAVIAVASAVGFVGAKLLADLQIQTAPVVDAATLQQRQFAADFRPVRSELQQNVTMLGVAVSSYETGEIDRAELQRRLSAVLHGYQDTANELDALDVPPAFRPTAQQYLETLNTLTQSVTDLSRAYDDGDQARVAQALALTLEAAPGLAAQNFQ